MISVSSEYDSSKVGGTTPPRKPVVSMASIKTKRTISPRYPPPTKCSKGWKVGRGCFFSSCSSQRVKGRIPVPNMDSSVFTITCSATECHDEGRTPNFCAEKLDTGRWTAALTPVPKMRDSRVGRSCDVNADERRQAELSFTIASRETLRFWMCVS